MHILSQESFESISYLIQNQSYGNIVARMEVDLHPVDAHFFARIRQEGNRGTWYTDVPGDYRTFKEATPQEQELIAIEMEERKQSITAIMQAKMPYIHNVFIIPSENQIFFRKDENGDIRVTLAQWGFKANGEAGSEDILSAIIARPRTLSQTDVWIQVLYSDGYPATRQTFNLHLFNALKERSFQTDDEGKFHLGNLINGKDFHVNDGVGHEKQIVVTTGQTLYVIEFPLYTNYEIVVQNQEGTKKEAYRLLLDGVPFVTGDDGSVHVDHVLLEPEKQITVKDETGHSEAYLLARDGNCFLFRVMDRFTSQLEVKVSFDDGQPIPDRKVRVGTTEYVTNEDGLIIVPDLEPDSTVHVQDVDDPSVFVDKQLERGGNKVELVIEKPKPQMVRIRLFDVEGNPIPNTCLRFETKLGPLEAVTDQDGAVFFAKELFTDKEKVKLRFEYVDPKDKKKGKKGRKQKDKVVRDAQK